MKKRYLSLIAIALLALIAPTLLVACDTDAKVDYSVTVLSPTDSPLANITVNWLIGDKVAGTAQTDANGKATASLTVGTYSVTLADFEEGLDYTPFSVTSAETSVTVNLNVKRVNYVTTVKDKNGAPASGVTVNWTNNGAVVGTAKTGADGKATCELNYGEYKVTISNLPEGNLPDLNREKTVNGSNPTAEFALRDGVGKNYVVTVKSEGGLLFKKQSVKILIDGEPYFSGETNENGEFRFSDEANNYTAVVVNAPEGYTGNEAELTPDAPEGEIIMRSKVISTNPAANQRYVIGDIIHDYEFTTPYNMANGKPWSGSIAEILKTKKAVIINNWGLNCSWCLTEMPDMQEVYEQYSDKIEIIAVNNFSNSPDTDTNIRNFQASKGFTFPMMRDIYGLSIRFGLTNWPTTIVIDRYGAIARIEVGAVLGTEAWERLILKYIGDDYVQTFTPGDRVSQSINEEIAKPDVKVPDDHYTTQVPGVLHNTSTFPANTTITWYAETEYEYAWPFVIGEDKNISETEYLCASNVGKPSTMAIIYADITVSAGKVLAFEYYTDSEANDVLNFVWDGKIIRQLSGLNNSRGWQTCYLYTELTDGDHTLAIAYYKNRSGDEGRDNVYLRNIHFVDIENIVASEEPIDMLRGAAYGQINEGDTQFPHYAEVYLDQNDGYYHVRLNSLQNASFAGNDENPLLLVNLLNVTPWSPTRSLNQWILGVDETTGENYADCSFALDDGVVRNYREELARYLKAAGASDVDDMAPVDQRLHDLLVAFMMKLSGQSWHENEWLEVCFYYSHYGAGEPVGNPIMGLMKETAITLEEDVKTTANLTRIMAPFPTVIYAFTPTESGLYKFESFIPDKDAEQYMAQVWLYDDNSDPDHPIAYSGNSRINLNATNEQNFEIYRNLEAGHKYYIEVALLMNEMGAYEFSVKRVHEDVTVWEPASEDFYEMILDDEEHIVGILLANAVNYDLYTDGYYRIKNDDGSWGDYIYLDVLRVNTSALGSIPLKTLVDMDVQDPKDFTINLGYKFFDFRYCVMYYEYKQGDEIFVDYLPKVDIQSAGDKYTNYTAILQGYINSAPTEGEYKGLIKVNKEIADILKMFFELRLNNIWADVATNNGEAQIDKYEIEAALENEWLRFCWYKKTYEADNE